MPVRLVTWAIGAAAIIILILYFVSGDSSATIDVSCNDFPEQGNNVRAEIEIDAWDDFLVLNICSNPTADLQWELIEITDDNKVGVVLSYETNEFPSAESEEITGAPDHEVWTFKVDRVGTANITMEYSQPGEDGEKAVRTLFLSAHVE